MISVFNRKKPAFLVCRPSTQHGNSALPYEQHTVLKNIDISVPDDEQSRCLSTSYIDEDTETVCATILNKQLSTHCVHISRGFAHGFQNNSQRYEHNLRICPGLLDSYHHKGEVIQTH